MTTIEINGTPTILHGLAPIYFQEGMPLGEAVNEARLRGYDVSWLHIADEFQKQGWLNRRILAYLKQEIALSNLESPPDIEDLAAFLEMDYEAQRGVIFDYLFSSREQALEYMLNTDAL